nr:MAG TPA: hypothetical protein [Caudoviricetes sp.]
MIHIWIKTIRIVIHVITPLVNNYLISNIKK